MQPRPSCLLPCVLLLSLLTSVEGDYSRTIETVLDLMEASVLDLAQQVELLYQNRCATLERCASANFDACRSALPQPTCSSSDHSAVPCNGTSCGVVVDSTVSSVQTGPTTDDTDQRLVESICWARTLDPWWTQRRANETAVWEAVGGTRPSASFFASATGSFRSYPARPRQGCADLDPRVRPWYRAAASAGSQTVLVLLDVSKSTRGRWSEVQWAARTVVDELSEYDFLSVIVFAGQSQILGGFPTLVPATANAKSQFSLLIDELQEQEGIANVTSAFELAFGVLHQSYATNGTGSCHSAILLVTGSSIDDPVEQETVVRLVNDGMNRTKAQSNQAPQLFTFSLADLENTTQVGVHNIPQRLACESEFGFWKRIGPDDDLRVELSSYVNLYSWGLGGRNGRGVSWVKPYPFATGGMVGTTVSLPVFSSNFPATFLGVVGIDIGLDPLFQALNMTKDDFVSRENEVQNCPGILQLDDCKVEAYRRLGGLHCTIGSNCSNSIQVQNALCTNVTYPAVLWDNVEADGLDFASRACCSLAVLEPADQCTLETPGPPSFSTISVAVPTSPPASPPVVAPNGVGSVSSGRKSVVSWGIIVTAILLMVAI